MFPAMVREALRLDPALQWVVFASPEQPWPVDDPRVEVVRAFPGNDRPLARLWADHWRVPAEALRRGAAALLTVGFVPARRGPDAVMHVFTLHHCRSVNRAGYLRSLYRGWAIRSGLRHAALVITNSRWAAAEIGKLDPRVGGRLLVSPEGVDLGRFRPDAPEGEDEAIGRDFGVPAGCLLWVSNFYAYKRADLAIAAFAALPAELRRTHPFVLAGGDWHGGMDRARRAAARLGVANEVRFLGWVDDQWLPSLYRLARAQVIASTEETFGRNLLDAMACGCPCVVNALPVFHEVAGPAAEFADFTNSAIAAGALARLCTDGALAARLRTEGLARAREFSFERLARERIGAIMITVGQRGGAGGR